MEQVSTWWFQHGAATHERATIEASKHCFYMLCGFVAVVVVAQTDEFESKDTTYKILDVHICLLILCSVPKACKQPAFVVLSARSTIERRPRRQHVHHKNELI